MNMWVKPGISVGCIVLSCIISAIASSGSSSVFSVEAGTLTPTPVENITTYNEMIEEVGDANKRIKYIVKGNEPSATAGVRSYTLTETSNVGISYSVNNFRNSYSLTSMATRKIQMAVTEYELYGSSEIISLYNVASSSLSMDISSEIYISLADNVCYINIHKFNILKEGCSTSAPTDVIDKWFAFDADVLSRVNGNTTDSAEILIYYVLTAYSGSAFARVMSVYGSLYNSEQFAVYGTEYILKDNYLADYASALSGVSIPSGVSVNGKFSVNLNSVDAPVTTANYNCLYTGSSESLNLYENDKLVFENINNTVIRGAYLGGSMSLSDYMNYWGDSLK